jgi:hypothetical protein
MGLFAETATSVKIADQPGACKLASKAAIQRQVVANLTAAQFFVTRVAQGVVREFNFRQLNTLNCPPYARLSDPPLVA